MCWGSRYGSMDPRTGTNPVLHEWLQLGDERQIQVGRQLGFHVGSDGIVGRAVSVMSDSQLVGQGIIGWL